MSSPKVQIIKDLGCGLGAFATSREAEVLEGIAGHPQGAAAPGTLPVGAGNRLVALIATGAHAERVTGAAVVVCAAAVEAIAIGHRVRIDLRAGRIEDLTAQRTFTFIPK